mmetsp:Transcript_59304/g.123918  ORF Transcript_59304/g.123918 Transcript_59304/m.123918 type:complete len:233 (+) Transcript_59304:1714-2412(+)
MRYPVAANVLNHVQEQVAHRGVLRRLAPQNILVERQSDRQKSSLRELVEQVLAVIPRCFDETQQRLAGGDLQVRADMLQNCHGHHKRVGTLHQMRSRVRVLAPAVSERRNLNGLVEVRPIRPVGAGIRVVSARRCGRRLVEEIRVDGNLKEEAKEGQASAKLHQAVGLDHLEKPGQRLAEEHLAVWRVRGEGSVEKADGRPHHPKVDRDLGRADIVPEGVHGARTRNHLHRP